MKRLRNPFSELEGYNCFACSPKNEYGLKMEFMKTDAGVVCHWEPQQRFQGYFNILHGGIQATLMDEIASWLVFTHLKTGGVTVRLDVSYKKPVYTNKGALKIEANLTDKKRNIAIISVSLSDQSGNLCSQATAHYYLFSKEKAKKKLSYPDESAFFCSDNKITRKDRKEKKNDQKDK